MNEKYYEIEELIREYDSTHWEYQEVKNEAREDLTRAIFKHLNLCEECGQSLK